MKYLCFGLAATWALLHCTVTETIPVEQDGSSAGASGEIEEPGEPEPTEPQGSAGAEGEPQGSAGAGGMGGMGGSENAAGAGGSPVVEEPRSDIIEVDDGDFTPGAPPVTGGEATLPQIVSVVGPPAVTNGGSAILHVELSAPVESPLFVVGLAGDTGYHTVTGTNPDGDSIYDITTVVAAGAAQTSLTFSVALTDGAGNVGQYREVQIPVVQSGTGDVKITLSWDRLHDLDLRVTEPSGEQIQYTNQSSATGGELDLDSGANCGASAANSENIFWPRGGGPTGEYVVTVHNFQQCTPGPIDYTVRVVYDNVVNTYRGTFADGTASDMVTEASSREITRFRR